MSEWQESDGETWKRDAADNDASDFMFKFHDDAYRGPRHYILDENGAPMLVDMLTWAQWLQSHHTDRVVARTDVTPGVCVSTVFLGLDHNFSGKGPPLLFETVVFGGVCDGYTDRYERRAEAERGHDAMVVDVRLAEEVIQHQIDAVIRDSAK